MITWFNDAETLLDYDTCPTPAHSKVYDWGSLDLPPSSDFPRWFFPVILLVIVCSLVCVVFFIYY